MEFEFVNETPERRGINRHNNRVIQKRATQVAARSRRSKKPLSLRQQTPYSGSQLSLTTGTKTQSDTANTVTPALLWPIISYVDPFLSKFGRTGHTLLTQAHEPSRLDGYCCQSSSTEDSQWSVLQMGILLKLSLPSSLRDAERMFKIVKLTQTKFLEHLPSRYGHDGVLDAAIGCLLSRCGAILAPYSQQYCTMTSKYMLPPRSQILYARALNGFREALTDHSVHDMTNLWYAALILMLYELLDDGDVPGWKWHSVGAAQLLQKLGPESLMTAFHQSLLASHSRTLIIEAIIQKSDCFLDKPLWQTAIRSTVLPEYAFGDRSLVATELWLLNAKVPNILRRTEDCVSGTVNKPRQQILDDIKRLWVEYQNWQKNWEVVLARVARDKKAETNTRFQATGLLGVYLCFCVILLRLQSAIDPVNGHTNEDRVRQKCDRIYQLRMTYVVSASRVPDHGSFFGNVAIATLSTADEWKVQMSCSKSDECIDSTVFNKWYDILRKGSQ